MFSNRFFSACAILLFLLPGQAWGQAPVDQASRDWNERIHQLSFLNRTDAEYRLGSGDLIQVSVFGVEDFQYELRVNSRGLVTLPFVGALPARGMTPDELAEEVRVKLDAGLIRNPQVSVFVKEYRSQPVFVLGAVKLPGQYQVVNQLNLVDAIAMAGGLVPEKAAERAIVQRRFKVEATDSAPQQTASHGPQTPDPQAGERPPSNGDPRQQGVIEIDLLKLLEEGDLSLNIPIRGGDVIHVPERKRDLFYVVGEVNRAGAYEIPPKNKVLVSQAITWAGGPTKTAKLKKGIMVRYDGNGGRQEIPVNFKDIMEGKKSDFRVEPNDIVFIPGSTAKTLAYGLLGAIPGVTSAATYGAVR